MQLIPTVRRALVAAVAGGVALSLAACGGSGATGTAQSSDGDVFVFGAQADPVSLDAIFLLDTDSLRVARQIYQGLVKTAPGGTTVEPDLATKWDTPDGGKSWVFTLKKDVKFSDGTDFNADAVCTNFDRWYNFTGILQSQSMTYYWNTVFGGFHKNEAKDARPSLFAGCEANDPTTVTLKLTEPSSSLVSALALPAFGISSPTALKKYDADSIEGSADAPLFKGSYGTAHPTSTGPFMLKEWIRGDHLTLVPNPHYSGPKVKLKEVVFKPLKDANALKQALEAGDIDAYDSVAPGDVPTLKAAGFQLDRRDAFNVGYMGMTVDAAPLNNVKIRQAIAHAIDKQAMVKAMFPEGTDIANQFLPPSVWGYAKQITEYNYDPALAKKLVAESGVSNPTVELWYPSDTTRNYMPDPKGQFQAIAANLEAAGIKVVAKSAPWSPDYLSAVVSGKAQMYLIGWSGDYADPDNFIGSLFKFPTKRFGAGGEHVQKILQEAASEPDHAKREALYVEANQKIMEWLPGVPLVNTKPYLALAASVQGYQASPVGYESFETVSVSTP